MNIDDHIKLTEFEILDEKILNKIERYHERTFKSLVEEKKFNFNFTLEDEKTIIYYYCKQLLINCYSIHTSKNNTKYICLGLFRRFYLKNTILNSNPTRIVKSCIILGHKINEESLDLNFLSQKIKNFNFDYKKYEVKILESINFDLVFFNFFGILEFLVNKFNEFGNFNKNNIIKTYDNLILNNLYFIVENEYFILYSIFINTNWDFNNFIIILQKILIKEIKKQKLIDTFKILEEENKVVHKLDISESSKKLDKLMSLLK